MKLFHTILCIFLLSSGAVAQITYKGSVENDPIELVMDDYLSENMNAIYTYTNLDIPFPIKGTFNNGKLTYTQTDHNGKDSIVFSFDNYTTMRNYLTGDWVNIYNKKKTNIRLIRDSMAKEILQPVALNNYYFKLIISVDDEESVAGIKVLEKKTDKLIQKIDLECQLWGLNNTSIGDFNFDGFMDFSVFEMSYAGPNTSSLYYLFTPKTGTFVNSGFEGVSLDFDNKNKRISEHNQCCAGRQHTIVIYKVAQNKMVPVEKHCYIWSEKKQDTEEHPFKDCE